MDKKEQILDLYFNNHLKQTEIAEIVNALKFTDTKKENEESTSSSSK